MFLCLIAFPAATHAQSPLANMDAPAARLADTINKSNKHEVVVFDFSGPDRKMTALGQRLANDLRAALVKSSTDLQLVDRSLIEQKREANFYAPEIVQDLPSGLLFAKELGGDVAVFGEISASKDDSMTVELLAFRVDKGKGLTGLKFSLPVSKEISGLMANPVSGGNASDDRFPGVPKAGAKGYTLPRCVACPHPSYTDEALDAHLQGSVWLAAVINQDGRVTEIRVVKALPGGLTEKAVEAARTWRLSPARGPDGKPAAVQMTIQADFNLYQ